MNLTTATRRAIALAFAGALALTTAACSEDEAGDEGIVEDDGGLGEEEGEGIVEEEEGIVEEE